MIPGGLLFFLGGTGDQYPKLFDRIREIAPSARLHDLSPSESLQANEDPDWLRLVAAHVRENVKWALATCPPELSAVAVDALSKAKADDVVNEAVQFQLPRFQALIFVRQGPSVGARRSEHVEL